MRIALMTPHSTHIHPKPTPQCTPPVACTVPAIDPITGPSLETLAHHWPIISRSLAHHWPIIGPSSHHWPIISPALAHHWPIIGPPLAHHWPTIGPSLAHHCNSSELQVTVTCTACSGVYCANEASRRDIKHAHCAYGTTQHAYTPNSHTSVELSSVDVLRA